jgi:hypothetical protein
MAGRGAVSAARSARQLRPVAASLLAGVIAMTAAACGSPGPSQDPTFGFPIQGTMSPTSAPGTTTPASTQAPATASATAPPVPASASWARVDVAPGGPAPREDHTWTVDAGGQTAYLFGGRSGGTAFDDLWAYDLDDGTWQEIKVTGPRPAARFGHEAAWTPVNGGLLVTLGQAGSTFFGDIWLFEPSTSTWRELPSEGRTPLPRYGSCSGIGPDGRLWVSHGFTEDGSRFSDTRAYDLEAEVWDTETPPAGTPKERCLHVCWWTLDGTFTLYGGQTTGVPALGDMWSLVPGREGAENEWFKLAEPEAAPRHLPAVAQRGRLTYLVGGRDIGRDPLGDTWLVDDGNAGAVTRLPTKGALPPRSGAAMVYDDERDRMLLFGGLGEAPLDDLWALTFD